MNFDFVIIQKTICRENKEGFSIKIAKKLNKLGFQTSIITEDIGKRKNKEDPSINDIEYWIIDFSKSETEKQLISKKKTNLKKQYNIFSLRNFYFTEYVYNNREINFYKLSNNMRDNFLEYKTIKIFDFLQDFLEKHNVKYFLQLDYGGEILRRAAYRVASDSKIPCFYLKNFPMDKKLGISLNEDDYVNSLEIKKYSDLTKKEIKESKNYLKSFRSDREMVLKLGKRPKENLINKFIKKYKRDKRLGKKRREKLQDYMSYIANNIIPSITSKMSKIRYKKLWEKPKPKEKFFFFPLHYHCESILTFRNPQFWKQEWIVEYVARCLPEEYKLYVKPHPEWNASFPYDELKEISKIANVKLIDPNENSHKLIRKSSAVVVVSNTTGYEAILHGRPVVCLGKVYYRDLGFTIDVSNLCDLSKKLNKALDYDLKEKDIIRFVNGFQKQYDGYTRGDYGQNGEPLFLKDKNIEKVAKAIIDFVDELEDN